MEKLISRFVAKLEKQITKNVIQAIKGLDRVTKGKPGRKPSKKTKKGKPGRPKGSKNGKKGKKPGRPKGKVAKCSVKGCKNPARAKGLCTKHYQQARYAEKHGKGKK